MRKVQISNLMPAGCPAQEVSFSILWLWMRKVKSDEIMGDP
jgi:hypothetical protein